MKLESQLHVGYCMGNYASDAGSHLYFSQNLLFSWLKNLCLALASLKSWSEEVQVLVKYI